MRLRAATVDDASRFAALHAECFFEAWDAKSFASLLDSPGIFGFLAEKDDRTAGFVLVRAAAEEAEILSIGVKMDSRRHGLGTRLVKTAAQHVGRLGVSELFLEVGNGNVAARELYASLGFSKVGERPRYYTDTSGVVQDAEILRALLPLAACGVGNAEEFQ